MEITKPKIEEPSDKDIASLTEHARQAVRGWQVEREMTPLVIFKHTCSDCGQRGFVEEPNTVPQFVRCEACGKFEPYDKGGYSLAFALQGTTPYGETANYKTPVAFSHPTVRKVRKSAPNLKPAIPVKLGMRCEPDGTFTALNRDACLQFAKTCDAQEERMQHGNS